MRVIVSGAGVAGLTAAAALIRDGHRVTVLERRHQTAAGAGISLWPNALAALDAIELGDAVRSAAARIDGGTVRRWDGTWVRRPADGLMVAALGEPLAVIRRRTLRDVLTAALPAGTVRHGVTVRSGVTDRGQSTITTGDGEQLHADLLIAADGVRSATARSFNRGLRDHYTGYTAWRGIADCAIDPGLAGEVLGPRSQFGVVPLPGGQTYWFATRRLPEATRFDDELAQVRRLAAGWPDPIGEVVAATAADDLIRNDLYDRPTARRWHHGRTVLIGDAAHPMRPHLGQGGCQGIEDAVVLAALLRTTAATPTDADVTAVLARYQRRRAPRVRRVVAESRIIGQIVNAPFPQFSDRLIRASRLIPDTMFFRHLGRIASYSSGLAKMDFH